MKLELAGKSQWWSLKFTMPSHKKMTAVRFSGDLLERLDAWRASQTVPPVRTAVIEQAVVEFLDRQENGKKPVKRNAKPKAK